MEELPSEITASILSSLPKVCRPELREVCKTWGNLLPKRRMCLLFGVPHRDETNDIVEFYYSEQNNNDKVSTNDNKLTKLHHSLIMPAESVRKLVMVGSCNGLVCYAGYAISRLGYFLTLKQVYICNPVTREQIPLQTEEWDGDFWAEPGIGFDYNDSSEEYKVVRILCDHRCRGVRVQVYTFNFKNGSEWKSKTCRSNVDISSYLGFSPSAGVFAGGALHWIDQDNVKRTTVSFDVEHETFELLPSVPSVAGYANVGLIVLGGNLCVLDIIQSKHVTVWELRNRKPVICTDKDYVFPWVMKFSIAWEEDWSWFEFAETKSHKFFSWYNVIISCYDHETKTLRKLDEALKKLMDASTFWVYTATRAVPFVIPFMEERTGKESSQRKKRRTTFFLYG
ncbi:F-box only protein 6-like [Papaver somniferum]|uniref:F-box only protein 6-like n=1 Tax=Papaver somniferum TaxID=3469 RepID=UPI000E70600E|nr:F-box only protein 6-like [Papaver somniferum]